MSYTDPKPEDLRDAAIVAEAYLRVDSARLYGLIKGGPTINVERCEEMIAMARAAGHTWSEDDIDGAIGAVVAAHA